MIYVLETMFIKGPACCRLRMGVLVKTWDEMGVERDKCTSDQAYPAPEDEISRA
jgi:hypothetical protein